MKKLISGFLASALIFGSLSISAFASGTPITPYGATCGNCPTGEVTQEDTVYTPWLTVGTQTCPYNPRVIDDIEERSVITTWRCDTCGHGTSHTSTETRVVHNHP